MILFIVAFLLMALSFLMHQRSNSEVLGELQDSVTAMQEVQATQDALLDLQNQLDEAQTTIDALESSAEETDAALAGGPAGEPGTAGSVHHSAAVFCWRSGGLSSQHRRL